METTIKANRYINNGFSVKEAKKLLPEINKAFESENPFIVDFDGVKYFTASFFSTALTYLIGKIGAREYARKVKVFNLSESGKEIYQYTLEYSIEYYSRTLNSRQD